MRLTAQEIEAKRDGKAGWSRETLAAWGVPWPPPKGWKVALMKGAPVAPEKRR